MYLDEKMVAIERAFETADIAHAFGGANALAYYATPRATVDIDVNIFAPASRAGEVLASLGALGATVDAPDLNGIGSSGGGGASPKFDGTTTSRRLRSRPAPYLKC